MTRSLYKFLLLILINSHLVGTAGQRLAAAADHACNIPGSVTCLVADEAAQPDICDDMDFCETETDDHLFVYLKARQPDPFKMLVLSGFDQVEQLVSLYQGSRLLRPPVA